MRRFLILIMMLAIPCFAALPPQSPEERAESAEIIVEAQVLGVSSKKKIVKNGYNIHYTLRLKVLDVRKGKLGPQKEIEVFCKTTGYRPKGWAGPQGQNDIPDEKIIGLFYLRHSSQGWSLLEPNGWEPRPN
jgi:hypothetical protein